MLKLAYDALALYAPRNERHESSVVGHTGIVAVLKGQPVNPA